MTGLQMFFALRFMNKIQKNDKWVMVLKIFHFVLKMCWKTVENSS